MKNNPFTILILVITVLLPGLACSVSEAAAGNPFLENILSASDDREFNKALSIYGPLQSEDVKAVVKATESSIRRRRRNGALMLNLCRQDSCGEAQRDVVRKTKDVAVWALLVETAAREDEKLYGDKPELLKQALESDDADILAAALRVALKINYEGIQDRIRKLLDSKDPKVLTVVLNNLSPAAAKEESQRLARMLADDKTYGAVDMEIALALVRGADSQYEPAIKAFLDRLKREKSDHLFFNEAAFSEDKQTVDLLWKIARVRDGELFSELRDQAYDALTRRVWAPTLREPATVELMQLTLGYLKGVSADTNPRAHLNDANYGAESALYLVAFLNKGNTDHESFLYGKDAIAFTEKWLKEHRQ